jgi:hypothetical protein
MPRGPKGEKRPADVIGAAVKVMKIATGQEEEQIGRPEDEGKDPAAVALGRKGGRKGGKARWANLSPEQRSEAASLAAQSRWRKKRS